MIVTSHSGAPSACAMHTGNSLRLCNEGPGNYRRAEMEAPLQDVTSPDANRPHKQVSHGQRIVQHNQDTRKEFSLKALSIRPRKGLAGVRLVKSNSGGNSFHDMKEAKVKSSVDDYNKSQNQDPYGPHNQVMQEQQNQDIEELCDMFEKLVISSMEELSVDDYNKSQHMDLGSSQDGILENEMEAALQDGVQGQQNQDMRKKFCCGNSSQDGKDVRAKVNSGIQEETDDVFSDSEFVGNGTSQPISMLTSVIDQQRKLPDGQYGVQGQQNQDMDGKDVGAKVNSGIQAETDDVFKDSQFVGNGTSQPILMLTSVIDQQRKLLDGQCAAKEFWNIIRVEAPAPTMPKNGLPCHVHGEVLANEDFKTLQNNNWLNDKVLEAFMKKIKADQNLKDTEHIFVIPSYMAVLWELDEYTESMYEKVKMSRYKWIFMPVNINNHWVLLVAEVEKKMVSILDSLPTPGTKSILEQWKTYMKLRSRVTRELPDWEDGDLVSSKQCDGNSCGLFVLMNALAIVNKIPTEHLNTDMAKSMRQFVSSTLMQAAKSPPAQRTTCDMMGCPSPKAKTDWICCVVCGRWMHFACVDIHHRPKGDYVCPICIAQYE